MAAAAVAKPATPALSLDQIFTWGKRLGKGSFGEVLIATDKTTGLQYAIKMINKTKITSKHDVEALRREVKILKEVDHANVMRLFNTYESDKNVFLQLEYCSGGDLFSSVIANGILLEPDARRYFSQALAGIAHLHSKKIVHRDVKPENLLMSAPGSEATVKVADFGLSNMMAADLLSTWCGSPAYMAPELVKAQKYDEKIDMWSLGVVLYVLLSGCYPFWANSSKEIYEQIKDGWFPMPDDIWGPVSKDAQDLIKKLLVVDPAQRLSAEDALKHPWITNDAKHLAEDGKPKDGPLLHRVMSEKDASPGSARGQPPRTGTEGGTSSFGKARKAGQERAKKLKALWENHQKLNETEGDDMPHDFLSSEAVIPLQDES